MSVGKMVGFGLLGAGAAGLAALTGVFPDGLSEEMAKHITALDGAGVLDGSGIDVISKADFSALKPDELAKLGHHFTVEGDKVITFAKEGLTGINADKLADVAADKLKDLGLTADTLKSAATNVNGFATEVTDLAKSLNLDAVITKDNAQAAKDALAKFISPEKASEYVDAAMKGGQSIASYAKDVIGSTALDHADLIAKAAPPAAGAVLGAGAGLAFGDNDEKQVVGPNTARLMEQRRQALAQSLQQNGLRMS